MNTGEIPVISYAESVNGPERHRPSVAMLRELAKAAISHFLQSGTEHGAASAYRRAANPTTILTLISRLEKAEALVARSRSVIEDVLSEYGAHAPDEQQLLIEIAAFLDEGRSP